MLSKKLLERLYVVEKKSMQDIAKLSQCSLHKVHYWMQAHGIPMRSISDAIYLKHNPNGDPFAFTPPKTTDDYFLYGLGMGLYWGEVTKSNRYAVRLGNTDPRLLEKFMEFLMTFFGIKRSDFRFGLQIFSDISPQKSLDFWRKKLKIRKEQFYKVTVTKTGSIGTYRKKSQYGVLTVYYNNTKLRDLLIGLLPP